MQYQATSSGTTCTCAQETPKVNTNCTLGRFRTVLGAAVEELIFAVGKKKPFDIDHTWRGVALWAGYDQRRIPAKAEGHKCENS